MLVKLVMLATTLQELIIWGLYIYTVFYINFIYLSIKMTNMTNIKLQANIYIAPPLVILMYFPWLTND